MESWRTLPMVKLGNNYVLGYVQIDSIHWIICCTLFLLSSDTHNLQLAKGDVYKARVHVLIWVIFDPNI